MKAALLSAGPSLKHTYSPAEKYDVLIGVNTAAQLFKCDWWACADSHRVEEIEGKVKGRPRLFMIDGQRDQMNIDVRKRWKITGWKEAFSAVDASTAWTNNTAPAGLILAKWLGATEIDCYGVDMAGQLDVTGVNDATTEYRNEQRWALERSVWTLIVDWLAQRGTKVTRHGV